MRETSVHPDDDDLQVVLIPGLWMPASVMLVLERRLARCGFRSIRFAYPSMRADLDENAARLAHFVQANRAARIHLVGHSLGGVLALHATASFDLRAVHRIAMMGSPYRGSHAARTLARVDLGRRMLGRTIPQWLAGSRLPVPNGVEVGVIAGTVAFGLGALLARDLQRPHDGVVSVEETAVAGMRAAMQVPVSHSCMLFSSAVARLVCRFLRCGEFDSQRAHDGRVVE